MIKWTRLLRLPSERSEIPADVETLKSPKNNLRPSGRLISSLTRNGRMIVMKGMIGDLIEVASTALFLRTRAVHIDSGACQPYPGILSAEHPMASVLTDRAPRDGAIS